MLAAPDMGRHTMRLVPEHAFAFTLLELLNLVVRQASSQKASNLSDVNAALVQARF